MTYLDKNSKRRISLESNKTKSVKLQWENTKIPITHKYLFLAYSTGLDKQTPGDPIPIITFQKKNRRNFP